MKSQIFVMDGYGAPARPSYTLLSNEILSKLGEVNILSRNIEPQALQDYFQNVTFAPDAEGYINIVLNAHGNVIDGTHHIITHSGLEKHVDTPSGQWIAALTEAVKGQKVKLFVNSCYGENMQQYLDLLPKGSVMMTISSLDSTTHGCDFLHPDMKKLFDSLPQEALNFDSLLQTYCLFQQDQHYEPIIGVHSLNGTRSTLRLNGEMANSYVKEAKEFSSFLQAAFKANIITPENIIETLGSIYDPSHPEKMEKLIITYSHLIDGLKDIGNRAIEEEIPLEDFPNEIAKLNQTILTQVLQNYLFTSKESSTLLSEHNIFQEDFGLRGLIMELTRLNGEIQLDLLNKQIKQLCNNDTSEIDSKILSTKDQIKALLTPDNIESITCNKSPEQDLLKWCKKIIDFKLDTPTPYNDFMSKHSVALVCAAEAGLKQAKKLAQMEHIEPRHLTPGQILDQALAEFDPSDKPIYNQILKAAKEKLESTQTQGTERFVFEGDLSEFMVNVLLDISLEEFSSLPPDQQSLKLAGASADSDS